MISSASVPPVIHVLPLEKDALPHILAVAQSLAALLCRVTAHQTAAPHGHPCFSWQKEVSLGNATLSGIHILLMQLFLYSKREATSAVSEMPFRSGSLKWPVVSSP